MKASLPRLASALVVLVLVSLCSHRVLAARVLSQKETENELPGFLSDEVPLTVISTIPEKLLSGGNILVNGRQALTVVLSRPVIPMNDDPDSELTPFFLQPPVEGEYRWLSTYIVTFEPKRDWAADLEVEFQWNPELTTYDGVPLTVRRSTNSRLTTPTLNLTAVNVVSNETNYLTGNNWDAFVGTRYDVLPEVPNDGHIEVRASSDMKLGALQNFLRVQDGVRNTPVDVEIKVVECAAIPDEPCTKNCGPDPAPKEDEEVEPEETSAVYDAIYGNTDGDDDDDEDSSADEYVDSAGRKPEKKEEDDQSIVSSCANISFTSKNGFIPGRKYSLILPAGTNYSNDAGPLKRDIKINFGGIRDFRIPFVETKNFNVTSPVLDMWLPHGLAPDVNISKFPMKIVRPSGDTDIVYDLEQISKSVLRINLTLTPGVNYKVTVFESTTIKDGFGQRLKRSSLNFLAAPITPLFKAMEVGTDVPYALFESGQDWGQKIIAFAKGSAISDEGICEGSDSAVGLWDVPRAISTLPLFAKVTHEVSMAEYLGLSAARLVSERKNLAGEIPEYDITNLLKTTGIVATQYCRNEIYYPLVIVESKFQVVVLSTGASTDKGRTGLVWVTDMVKSKAVANAEVTIFRKSGKANVVSDDYKLFATSKTDKNGVGVVTLDEDASELHALVEIDGKNIYVPHVQASASLAMDISDSIILDRSLVKPGETLHIKGYVMQNKDNSFLPSNLKNYRLIVSPSMSSAKRTEDVYDLDKFDKDFGTYTYTLTIPVSVPVVPYTIQVAADSRGQTYIGEPHHFTVADGRQPAVVLSVEAPHWALPNKNLKIKTHVKTFSGAAIENAPLKISWSVKEEESLSGTLSVKSDKKGTVSATIPLGKAKVTPGGTVLEIIVQHSSPSGDSIEESVHIRLEHADVDIHLDQTIQTDIPGQEFGVRATVTDLKGAPLHKKLKVTSVTVSLKEFTAVARNGVPAPRPLSVDSALSGKSVQFCKRKLQEDDYCTFKLPKMGVYVVEACVSLGKSQICKRMYAGKSEEEWKEGPLREHLPFGITPITKGPYKMGDTAEFMIENPFESVSMLVAWGGSDKVSTEMVSQPTGRNIFKFKIDETCSNNCALSLVASIPRQEKGIVKNVKVILNDLFDLAAPHTIYYTTVIETEKDSTLGVKISVPEVEKDNGIPLIEPGLNASVRVDFDRKGPTEITVIAVDKAVLDLLPYSLKDVSRDLVADLASYFHYKSTDEYLVAPDAIDTIVKANEERQNLDPWFEMLTRIHPSQEDADTSLTEEEYLKRFVQYLTVKPSERMTVDTITEETETMMDKAEMDNDKSTKVENEGAIGLQASYVPTSLFTSYTASGGEYLVNFEGPRQGGDFVIRAYASSGTGLFGSDEVTVTVKKALSIATDFPSFIRLGDKVQASIVISTASVLKDSLTLTIRPSESLVFEGSDVIIIDMNKDLEREIEFTFVAEGIGEGEVIIVADDGTGNSATAEIRIPVHGSQEAVVVGSTFSVEGSTNGEPMTKMEIPNALEGSGSVVVSAGTGQQQAILILSDLIRSEETFTCPVSADYALASVAIPAIFDTYNPWGPDPNLLPQFMVDLINGAVDAFDEANHHLTTLMTSSKNGLMPSHACPGTGFVDSIGVSLEQNAKGIFIINEIEKALRDHRVESIESGSSALFDARDIWLDILASALVAQAKEAKDSKPGAISIAQVALVRLALGLKWNPPKGTDSKVAADISMDRLRKEFKKMSLENQAYYVLTLQQDAKSNKGEINKAINSWKSLMYTSGDRAYMVTKKGQVTPASNLANGLILLAMTRAGEKGGTLERMVTYISAPISDIYGFTSFSTYEKTVAMFALAEYDSNAKDKKASIRLEVRSGTNILLQHVFTPERRPAAIESTPWENLGKNPAPIEVIGLGSGGVDVAIALKFVPRDLLQYPVYKGIFVERTIQIDNAGEIGEGVETVPIGTVVNIKVHFMTPLDLEHTTVVVPLPAGLHPVQIGGEGADYCPVPFFSFFSEDYYANCPEQVTRSDEVHFLYESVNAGSHAVSFKAMAAISGDFGLPAAKAFVTNSPDIMGLSSAGRFDICKPGKKCTIETTKRTFVAKQCNQNCNDNGVCDLNSGECLCFVGFGGPDCSKAAA